MTSQQIFRSDITWIRCTPGDINCNITSIMRSMGAARMQCVTSVLLRIVINIGKINCRYLKRVEESLKCRSGSEPTPSATAPSQQTAEEGEKWLAWMQKRQGSELEVGREGAARLSLRLTATNGAGSMVLMAKGSGKD